MAFDAGESADESGAIAGFELLEFGTVGEAGKDLAHLHRSLRIAGDEGVEVFGGVERGFGSGEIRGWASVDRESVDEVADDFEGVLVVIGQVVGDSGEAGVDVASAQVFGGNFFASGGFYERRSAEEDGALAFDDDGFIGHGGDVGSAGGAGTHDGGDLGNASGGEVGLVVEDASEVVFIGEDFGLEGEKSSAGVDQVDAREVVFEGDLLGAQVLFDGDGEVGSAFHRGIVGDDDALFALDASDPGNDSGAGGIAVVHSVGSEGGEF